MATQKCIIELEDSVYNDFIAFFRKKTKNPALAIKTYIEEYIKRQVKIYRLATVTEVQKDTLIDMTGL